MDVAFCHQLDEQSGVEASIPPAELPSHCEEEGIKQYSYEHTELRLKAQY